MKKPTTPLVMSAVAALVYVATLTNSVEGVSEPTAMEAPAGFDLESNGFAEEFCSRQSEPGFVNTPEEQKIPEDECSFDAALEEFTGPEFVEDGLGPVFNAAGCGECHVTPAIGGFSQIVEKRAGIFDGLRFTDHPGGSLIHDRALDPSIQERVLGGRFNVIAFRATMSTFGDGYVEAIDSNALTAIAANQPSAIRGQIINVPVLEAPGSTRAGRFGWKDQHASLVSFSADAYLNEMGITSPLQPVENTSNGESILRHDTIPDPDDQGIDVELFALFMRSLKAPPRDAIRAATFNARAGKTLFDAIGCSMCHRESIVTAPPDTLINGGAMKVSRALGNKVIHPFSDFLLHDIGTGDGIVQNGGASTRNKVRTAALWGLRARGRFMHDGLSLSLEDAIDRHRGQAWFARREFYDLRDSDRRKIIDFLMSL
jgi:CxxC motif-containing protein (DUF1111 family)